MPQRLPRSFYRRDPKTVAKALLGLRLVHLIDGHRHAGIIVETEAYLGVCDKAAHTYGGRRTPRNQTMWGDGGHLYVYFTYGMHHCANVVAGRTGDPVAVLLRALDPTDGLDTMRRRRRRDVDLCSGPARLCQALAIDRSTDGLDLVGSPTLYIEPAPPGPETPRRIVAAPRIGVQYAGAWARRRLRFYLKDSPHVSTR